MSTPSLSDQASLARHWIALLLVAAPLFVHAQSIPNDNFDDAETITATVKNLRTVAFNRTDDGNDSLAATREPNEPQHAGNSGADPSGIGGHPIAMASSRCRPGAVAFNTLLAVYTGDSVDTLTEIASNNGALFYPDDFLTFSTEAGTTYHIAIDGFNNGATVEFGGTTLAIDRFVPRDPPNPIEKVLLPPNAEWEYLHHFDESGHARDPAELNPDFYTTWFSDSYSGAPAFEGPAPGMFGYGIINSGPITKRSYRPLPREIAMPPTSEPTFTPTRSVDLLAFEGIIDDGAVFYVNEVEVARYNMQIGVPNEYDLHAEGASPETYHNSRPPSSTSQPANPSPLPCPSTTWASGDDSDLAFFLAVYDLLVEPPSFQASIERLPGGEILVTWDSTPGTLYNLEFSADLANWTPIGVGLVGSAGASTSFQHLTASPRQFYRVVQF